MRTVAGCAGQEREPIDRDRGQVEKQRKQEFQVNRNPAFDAPVKEAVPTAFVRKDFHGS